MLEDDPADPTLLSLLGEVDLDAAVLRMKQLFFEDPETWYYRLTELLLDSGRFEEGLGMLRERLAKNRGDLEAISELGGYRPDEAEHYLRAAFPSRELNDGAADLFDELGDRYWDAGDPKAAADVWVEYLWRQEQSSDGTLYWSDRFEETAPDVLFAIVLTRLDEDSSADALGDCAGLAWRTGHSADAIRLWKQALERFPDWEDWQANLDAVQAGEEPPFIWN